MRSENLSGDFCEFSDSETLPKYFSKLFSFEEFKKLYFKENKNSP